MKFKHFPIKRVTLYKENIAVVVLGAPINYVEKQRGYNKISLMIMYKYVANLSKSCQRSLWMLLSKLLPTFYS